MKGVGSVSVRLPSCPAARSLSRLRQQKLHCERDVSSSLVALRHSSIDRRLHAGHKKSLSLVVRASSSPGKPEPDQQRSIQLYGSIERVFEESARKSQGAISGRWEEIEGAWITRPSNGQPPSCIVHFIGGAFVGASPQLTYRLFLETLSDRGALVIATPYASGLDHLRIADEAQFKFDRAHREITRGAGAAEQLSSLPVFGVGHSMGALTHLLIGARYAVQSAGNVLIAFNNKEASAAIPLFSPVILPMAQNMGPLISQLTTNPALKFGADMAFRQLQDLKSPLLSQLLPLLEQLPPLYKDLADGKDEFTPSPDDTRRLLSSYYGVRRNLLLRFQDDSIDETPQLANLLSHDSAISDNVDLSIRTLPGDHARPLHQIPPDLPPAISDVMTQGEAFLNVFAAGTPLASFAKGVGKTFGVDSQAQEFQQDIRDDMAKLVDEIAQWMGIASGLGAPKLLSNISDKS